jgi:hypothetical protein
LFILDAKYVENIVKFVINRSISDKNIINKNSNQLTIKLSIIILSQNVIKLDSTSPTKHKDLLILEQSYQLLPIDHRIPRYPLDPLQLTVDCNRVIPHLLVTRPLLSQVLQLMDPSIEVQLAFICYLFLEG